MAADSLSRHDRRLRGAVAQLAHRPMADIEAVWHALTDDERAQLGPLLADAAAALSSVALELVAAPPTEPPDGQADAPHEDGIPAVLARLAGHWPDALLMRAVRSFGSQQVDAFLAQVPVDRRETLSRQPATPPLTSRAHEALMQRARQAADTLSAPAPTEDTVADTARTTWARRLVRSFRKGRA